MLPAIFGENLFDDFFADPFGMMPTGRRSDPLYGKHAQNLMKTDVREKDNAYELDVDLPGFKKDEITVDLKDGYLTIGATKGLDKEQFKNVLKAAQAQNQALQRENLLLKIQLDASKKLAALRKHPKKNSRK